MQAYQTGFKHHLSYSLGSGLVHLENSMVLNDIYLRIHRQLVSSEAQKSNVRKFVAILLTVDNQLSEWKKKLPQSILEIMNYVDITDYIDFQKTNLDQNVRNILLSYEEALNREGPMRDKMTIWLKICNMLYYFNIIIVNHSMPAFDLSCLRLCRRRGSPKDAWRAKHLSNSAMDILNLTFNMKVIRCDSCIAHTATHPHMHSA